MNRPIDPLQLNPQTRLLKCAFYGCDRWTFTRWCGAISHETDVSYTLFPNGSIDNCTITSNATLLQRIALELPSNSLTPKSHQQSSYSCGIIDLPFDDFDADVFKDLNRLIERLRSSTLGLIAEPHQYSSPVIVVCLPESRMAARDWITGLGANIVVDRFARVEETVKRLVEASPRICSSIQLQ